MCYNISNFIFFSPVQRSQIGLRFRFSNYLVTSFYAMETTNVKDLFYWTKYKYRFLIFNLEIILRRTVLAHCCLGILSARRTEIQCIQQGWVPWEHTPVRHLKHLLGLQPIFNARFLLLNSLQMELFHLSTKFSRCFIVYSIRNNPQFVEWWILCCFFF